MTWFGYKEYPKPERLVKMIERWEQYREKNGVLDISFDPKQGRDSHKEKCHHIGRLLVNNAILSD